MDYKFQVTGMTCAACSARVEKVVSGVTGVEHVEVNLLAGSVSVRTSDNFSVEQMIAAVTNAGYGVQTQKDHEPIKENKDNTPSVLTQMKNRILWSGVFLLFINDVERKVRSKNADERRLFGRKMQSDRTNIDI